MSGMVEEHTRSSDTSGRIVAGVLLGLLGIALVVATEGLGIVLGLVALAGAAYHLVVAAIANGVREGRDDR